MTQVDSEGCGLVVGRRLNIFGPGGSHILLHMSTLMLLGWLDVSHHNNLSYAFRYLLRSFWITSNCVPIKMGNGLSETPPSFLLSIPFFQSFHIVILGLDSAGKTTVLYRLQFNEFVNTVPTKGFNAEKVRLSLGNHRNGTFHFWDVGGQEKLRPLWKSYTRCSDGIIYVVDSVDAERMEEAKTELHKIIKTTENQGVPLLVLANKQDLRHSLGLAEMERLLALKELGPATPWHLQPACAIIGDGLREGLERLHDMILKRRKVQRKNR